MDREARIVAIIQARMRSARLPGKVLKEIDGLAMLGWVVERTRRSSLIDKVVVATTINERDDAIVEYCQVHDIPDDRGSEFDVLDRLYKTARKRRADVIVRITADCPFIDPGVIDKTLKRFFEATPKADFAANRLPPPHHRTYPIGLDTEVVRFDVLEKAWENARKEHHREHVMPYIYEQPDRFQVVLIQAEQDYGDMRWTVDTEEDLKLVREIAGHFEGRRDFSWLEIISLYEQHPALKEINAGVTQKQLTDVDERIE